MSASGDKKDEAPTPTARGVRQEGESTPTTTSPIEQSFQETSTGQNLLIENVPLQNVLSQLASNDLPIPHDRKCGDQMASEERTKIAKAEVEKVEDYTKRATARREPVEEAGREERERCLEQVVAGRQIPEDDATQIDRFRAGQEARENPLKGPSLSLDTQYRMAPALSHFPRIQFHDGKGLFDSDLVEQDNDIRSAVRRLTRSRGVKGVISQGTEFLLINAKHGVSRVEHNGTSLVNHANADILLEMIRCFLTEGHKGPETEKIEASMIQILTYQKGQNRLVVEKIQSSILTDEDNQTIEVSFVDSFEGKESRIVFVGTVAAIDRLAEDITKDDAKDAEDIGGIDYIRARRVTGYLRDTNRLNVALTRGTDCCIVLCQIALFLATYVPKRSKLSRSLHHLVVNAWERNCILDDDREDMHSASRNFRTMMTETRIAEARNKQTARDLKAIQRARYR